MVPVAALLWTARRMQSSSAAQRAQVLQRVLYARVGTYASVFTALTLLG